MPDCTIYPYLSMHYATMAYAGMAYALFLVRTFAPTLSETYTMANKTILSILALSGNKAAAVNIAARDFHAALFHLCHAGQATPLADTLAALPNRGKSAKIRAVVSDYWQAAAAYRAAVKADGRLDKSGRFVGLQADNIPFALADIAGDLSEAVATVKRDKVSADASGAADGAAADGADDNAVIAPVGSDVTANDALRNTVSALQTENEALQAENASLKAELLAAYAKITALEAAIEESGFDVVRTSPKAKRASRKPAQAVAMAA